MVTRSWSSDKKAERFAAYVLRQDLGITIVAGTEEESDEEDNTDILISAWVH